MSNSAIDDLWFYSMAKLYNLKLQPEYQKYLQQRYGIKVDSERLGNKDEGEVSNEVYIKEQGTGA